MDSVGNAITRPPHLWLLLRSSCRSIGRDRFGPVSYEGFVDSEGFDGGDGQVGVVGDGERAPLLLLTAVYWSVPRFLHPQRCCHSVYVLCFQ